MKKFLILGVIALIFSCQNSEIDYSYPDNPENVRKQRAGKFFDELSLFEKEKNSQNKSKLTANQSSQNKLWIASIEVVSQLLPLDIVDEKSGLIITEWYSTKENRDERVKINLLVKDSKPNPENLSLTIFKQTKDSKGNWNDSPNEKNSLTRKLIKDKIIAKTKSN